MGTFLNTADLAPFATIDEAKATEMIADAEAMAKLAAPCIADEGFAQADVVKAILRGAVLRWNDAGSGVVTTRSAGQFSETVDTSRARRAMFWPSEIEQLQSLCADAGSGAFAIDMTGQSWGVVHADICALNFGASYCSCGAVLTQGLPLYES